MVSPVELRQIGYQAAADFFEGIDSNVIDRQLLARGSEAIVEALIPYLCGDEPIAPTETGHWYDRLWRRHGGEG